MVNTMTVLAYLLTHDPGYASHLKLQVRAPMNCTQQIESPLLRWGDVPPEAASLAIIIKDAPSEKNKRTAEKPHYYWVVYNLPVETTLLPYGSNLTINRHDVGINSWGNHSYHTQCLNGQSHPVEIELFAVKKRFSAQQPMTGERLEQKIKGNALAKAKVMSS